jgi:hypothetical protein
VAHLVDDHLDVAASPDHQRGAGVAEVVEGELGIPAVRAAGLKSRDMKLSASKGVPARWGRGSRPRFEVLLVHIILSGGSYAVVVARVAARYG